MKRRLSRKARSLSLARAFPPPSSSSSLTLQQSCSSSFPSKSQLTCFSSPKYKFAYLSSPSYAIRGKVNVNNVKSVHEETKNIRLLSTVNLNYRQTLRTSLNSIPWSGLHAPKTSNLNHRSFRLFSVQPQPQQNNPPVSIVGGKEALTTEEKTEENQLKIPANSQNLSHEKAKVKVEEETNTVNAKDIPEEENYVEYVENVDIIKTKEEARQVLEKMKAYPDTIWGCDTEVAEIDIKSEGPVGNGKVTCISIYGGPDVDFGNGKGHILWVDNWGDSRDILQEFKTWFENPSIKKVWHNYGFDRHVMYNEGINCKGFAGDTMHMARLWDTSLNKASSSDVSGLDDEENIKGYSLQALSTGLVPGMNKPEDMKTLFGRGKLKKDGTEGAVLVLPPIEQIQTDKRTRNRWILYSADDAKATWALREVLQDKLEGIPWIPSGGKLPGTKPLLMNGVQIDLQKIEEGKMTMYDFYTRYLVPFGSLLTDLERSGIHINAKDYLADVEKQARLDQEEARRTFLEWAKLYTEQAHMMNPASSAQMQIFFFGGAKNLKTSERLPTSKAFIFEEEKPEPEHDSRDDAKGNRLKLSEDEERESLNKMKAADLKEICKEKGLKISGKKADLIERILHSEDEFSKMTYSELIATARSRGLATEGFSQQELIENIREDIRFIVEYKRAQKEKEEGIKKGPKKLKTEFMIRSLGFEPIKYTAGGWPACSIDVLRKLAGPPEDPTKGVLYTQYYKGRPEAGIAAANAVNALCNMGSIDTMLSNFLLPLQELVDEESRIHCSLNINTETGRLSARRPNLQNQPALEKDQYKIRKAFVSEEGKSLIVADYGQLELRLLAHITNCQSMIQAFKDGGCFHSRTAVGMFDHVRKAVDDGKVLLEWDYSKGDPPAPLLKDVYGSERRKAKTLNFSIAYGKTAHGLAKDWGVSREEAQEMLEAWYSDRPEVKKWQEEVIKTAKKTEYTTTLMGRKRKLRGIKDGSRMLVGHLERAAINTPIQGGAADVVMMAMIKLHRSAKLRELGWSLLLQIHDEVIMEGPDETKDEALKEVLNCMENPWDYLGLDPLLVKLTVDANVAKSWYEAK